MDTPEPILSVAFFRTETGLIGICFFDAARFIKDIKHLAVRRVTKKENRYDTYLRDPDQNGVELYWDRPKEQWPRDANGGLAMFTHRLDLDGLLKEKPTN